jgi:hypothetical protein
MQRYFYKKSLRVINLLMILLIISSTVNAQNEKLYAPYTKWYQDPLGLRPVELSSAVGFVWGSAAIAACLFFTKKDSSFQKRISFYQESGVSFGYKPPYTLSLQNNTGVLYKVRNWMSLGMEWNAFHFSDKTNNTWSFGVRPFSRWYPYVGKKISLFVEYGAGLSYSLNRFPLTGTGWDLDTARTGTHFNFTTKYGIGTEVHVTNRFFLQGGLRHFHLSNGNMKGMQRNPSYDGNGMFVGIIFSLQSCNRQSLHDTCNNLYVIGE